MAIVLKKQGKHNEALKMYKKSLAAQETLYGLEHPLIADTLFGTSFVYGALCQYELAAECLRRCIAIWCKGSDLNARNMLPLAQQRLQSCLLGVWFIRKEGRWPDVIDGIEIGLMQTEEANKVENRRAVLRQMIQDKLEEG